MSITLVPNGIRIRQANTIVAIFMYYPSVCGGFLLKDLVFFHLQDCSHVSKTREEFYSVRCTVADMKSLYVRLSFDELVIPRWLNHV